MNKLFIISVLLIFVSLNYSCKEDDDSYQYEFIDQTLQGTIDTSVFVYKTALAEKEYWDNNNLQVEIFEYNESDACNALTIPGKKVSFSVPFTTGLYKLNFSSGSNSNQTVTFYNPETNKTFIAMEGAIEITLLDTVINLVTGKIDAFVNDSCKVNGNFEAVYCGG